MRLSFTHRFQKEYRRLPSAIQKRTDVKLRFLIQDLSYPSLRIKKVRQYKNVFEGSISIHYRFLFQIKKDALVLLRIGTHDILRK